jgi:HPt (histidine-containing phosphotransfer) domain-containing protein
MDNCKKEVATMREALAFKDFEALRTISHGMKRAGGTYGFDRISQFAAAIDYAAKVTDAAPHRARTLSH